MRSQGNARVRSAVVNLTWRVYLEVWCAIIGPLHALFPKELFQGNEVRLSDLVLENFQPDWKAKVSCHDGKYITVSGGRLPAFPHSLAF
jgi:hypothetical protein